VLSRSVGSATCLDCGSRRVAKPAPSSGHESSQKHTPTAQRAARCRRTLEDALEDLSELVRRSRRALEAALRALLPAELLPQFLH